MSPLDYEILTDLAIALLISSGYYIWFKIELKAQFLTSLAATEKQLADANAACAASTTTANRTSCCDRPVQGCMKSKT